MTDVAVPVRPHTLPYAAYAAFAAICLIWGTTFLAMRVAIETIPTLMLPALRFTGAGAILMLICLLRGDRFPKTAREWLDQAINGAVMVALANTFVVWAEHHITSGLAALLAATIPLWMAVAESIFGTAPFTTRKSLGLATGFGGVVLLLLPRLHEPETNLFFFLATGAMQLSALCWVLGSLRARHTPVNAGPLAVASIHMLAGGLAVGVAAILHGDIADLSFTPRTFAALMHLMIFGSIIAYSAYMYALPRLQPSKLSLYAYVNPAVAVVAGWMILREPLTLRMIVAMLVILGGVAVVQSERLAKSR